MRLCLCIFVSLVLNHSMYPMIAENRRNYKMDFPGFVLILAALVCFKVETSTCTCPMCPDKIHPQDAFCSSDFVMRTTVTDITMVGDDPETADLDPQIKYNIIIDKVFKEPSVPSVEATCVVESLTSNATVGCFFSLCTLEQCSVQLDVDQTYLISGFLVDGQLKIDECGLHIPWEEVTSHMKIGLNKRYPNNCQCSTGEDKCIIDPPPTDICFCQYASCVEVQKEGCAPECKWKKSNTFKSCVQQATSPPL